MHSAFEQILIWFGVVVSFNINSYEKITPLNLLTVSVLFYSEKTYKLKIITDISVITTVTSQNDYRNYL